MLRFVRKQLDRWISVRFCANGRTQLFKKARKVLQTKLPRVNGGNRSSRLTWDYKQLNWWKEETAQACVCLEISSQRNHLAYQHNPPQKLYFFCLKSFTIQPIMRRGWIHKVRFLSSNLQIFRNSPFTSRYLQLIISSLHSHTCIKSFRPN